MFRWLGENGDNIDLCRIALAVDTDFRRQNYAIQNINKYTTRYDFILSHDVNIYMYVMLKKFCPNTNWNPTDIKYDIEHYITLHLSIILIIVTSLIPTCCLLSMFVWLFQPRWIELELMRFCWYYFPTSKQNFYKKFENKFDQLLLLYDLNFVLRKDAMYIARRTLHYRISIPVTYKRHTE